MSTRIIYNLAFCIFLHGCASAPSLGTIPDGETVSITVGAAANYPLAINVRNTAVSDGLSTGVGAGGVAGGLWGLTCGPFAVLCVPLGAAAGMVTGGVAGVAVGATGMLSKENEGRLKERLVRIAQTHPVLIEFKQSIEDKARSHWILDREFSKIHVAIEIQELQVVSTRDEHIRFVLQVLASVQDNSLNRKTQPRQKKYEYRSPVSSLAVWLDQQSEFLDTSLTSAAQQISTQVITDLTKN